MASRSLGELWLRPSTFARISQPTCRQSIQRSTPAWTCHRSISKTTHPAAQPKRKDKDYNTAEPEPRSPSQPQTTDTPRPFQTTTADQIGSLFHTPATFASPPQPTSPTSSDELRAARTSTQRVWGSDFSNGSRNRPPRRQGLQFQEMAFPESLTDPSLANKPSEAATLKQRQEETFANYPRLSPTYGRTVDLDVSKGRDIARGLGMLASLVARNRIKGDIMKQRFHERPGLRRKRLASERWRARFRKGFRQVTSRVSELTRKGW